VTVNLSLMPIIYRLLSSLSVISTVWLPTLFILINIYLSIYLCSPLPT